MGFWFWLKALAPVVVVHNRSFFFGVFMKINYCFNEDDRKYKSFSLNKKELAAASEYFNHNYEAENTELFCMYDNKNNFLAARLTEKKSNELTPEEIKKLFKKIPD